MTAQDLTPQIFYDREPTQSDQDCACPEPMWNPSPHSLPPALGPELYQISPGLYRAPLEGDYELVFNPACSNGPVALNQAAGRVFAAFQTPKQVASLSSAEQEAARTLAALRLIVPVAEE